jgi:DNA-binding response OmpR family regulator
MAPVESESRLISAARELVAHEVLVIDGDPNMHKGMVKLLAPSGLHVMATTNPERGLELIANKFFGVIVVDLDTPTSGSGIALVEKIRQRSPISLVLLLAARKSFDAAVSAFRAGAHDVILKAPDQVEYLKQRIVAAAGNVTTRSQRETLLVEIRSALEEFLKRLMSSDRKIMDLEDKAAGRDVGRSDLDDEVRVLFVDSDDRLFKAIAGGGPTPNFSFILAQSGGEALDRVTSGSFHIIIVGQNLPDLPGSLIIRSLKAQVPNVIVISYELGGRLEIVETTKTIPLVEKFTSATQLTERLGELAEAHRAKGRERRYLQEFRDRNYELLRRLAELRKKLDAMEDSGDLNVSK